MIAGCWRWKLGEEHSLDHTQHHSHHLHIHLQAVLDDMTVAGIAIADEFSSCRHPSRCRLLLISSSSIMMSLQENCFFANQIETYVEH